MKEFREIAAQIHYPETVNQSLRATIFDWFQFREICDDEKFETFFLRVINRDLARYQQLLRIEPGITNYDWLVQTYRERQNVVSFSGYKHSDVVSEGEQVKSDSLNSSNIKTFANTDARSDVKKANETSLGSEGSEMQHEKLDKSFGDISKTGQSGDVSSYGKKDVRSRSDIENESQVQNGTSDSMQSVVSDKNAKSLAKQSPQSISYSAGGGIQTGMPSALDWSYPGAQEEVGEQGHDLSASHANDGHKSSGHKQGISAEQSDLSENGSASKKFSEVNIENGVDISSGSDKIKKEEAKSKHYGEEAKGSTTRSGIVKDEKGVKGESEIQTQNGVTSQHQDDHMSIDQTVNSGRDLDPATLMENAKEFIKGTNAWSWFADQLEVCFMGIY